MVFIPEWVAKGQSLASEVEAKEGEQSSQAEEVQREKRASENRSVTRDVTRDVGQDRRGQDTTGEANYEVAPGLKSDNQEHRAEKK